MVRAIFLLICAYFSKLEALPAKSNRENEPNYTNTVIRVVLEKRVQKVEVTSLSNELYVKGELSRSWKSVGRRIQIFLIPFGPEKIFLVNHTPFRSTRLSIRGPSQTDVLSFKASVYRGALELSRTDRDFIVTNAIPLEQYLGGMLAAEMQSSWEMEALKAQAIASRTYALYMAKHPKSAFYDLEPNVQDQVYSGVGIESQRVKQAVTETAGQYLSFKGNPIKAYYHSRCGGNTETEAVVWQSRSEFNRRVICPYCQKYPYQWKLSVGKEELLRLLHFPMPVLNFRIALAEKTPTGRITRLKMGPEGKEKTLTSDQLRSLLGYGRMKSALFDWKVDDGQVSFEGLGSGHGVGMCQWGARYLAKQGKSHTEILAHFYPGTEIVKELN